MSAIHDRVWDQMILVVHAARISLQAQTRMHGWTADLRQLEARLDRFTEVAEELDAHEEEEQRKVDAALYGPDREDRP